MRCVFFDHFLFLPDNTHFAIKPGIQRTETEITFTGRIDDSVKGNCVSKSFIQHQRSIKFRLREIFRSLLESLEENTGDTAAAEGGEPVSEIYTGIFKVAFIQLEQVTDSLRGLIPRWTLNRLGEAAEVLRLFYRQDSNYIRYLQHDREQLPVLCATSRRVPKLLQDSLWKQGFPAILTSGTLKAGDSFARTRQVTGLNGAENVQ